MKSSYEYDRELYMGAIPEMRDEEDQTWDHAEEVEKSEAMKTRLLWGSNVPGSGAPERVLLGGIQAMVTMGYDMSEAVALIPEAIDARKRGDNVELTIITSKVFNIVNTAKKIPDHKFWKYTVYNSYDEYVKKVKFDKYPEIDTTTKDFFERTHAGWLAQIIGAALGTCIEGYTSDALAKAFGNITDYPRKPNTYNDDITFELAFLEAFKTFGYDITSADVGEYWAGMIPTAWAAEQMALDNMRRGIYPPQSGIVSNPWREWIGAQMRGAICGMVAPGDPAEAARLAYIDGAVSHHNNGIMGEIFNAVMVSLSYVENDAKTIMEKAFKSIPNDCEYYSVITFALEACKRHSDYMSAWKECEEEFREYNWIHAYPNAAAEVVALYFCKNDFDKCMNMISMVGEDVDCNAAQIATIFGCMQKHDCLDAHWVEPIGDDLYSFVRRYEKLTITELAHITVDSVNNAKSNRK